MKRIALLGSTGSIGRNTLDVVRRFPEKFKVVGLSSHTNTALLARQARQFGARYLCVTDGPSAAAWKDSPRRLLTGPAGLLRLCSAESVDLVVVAVTGASALVPVMTAIRHGKDVALANKEALVMAGALVMREAQRRTVSLLPIDSEQSAIWQCLEGRDRAKIKTIYLTASGGPFREYSKARLAHIKVADALKHPRWKMGKKITIDSATLMNKGFELFETMHLFGVSADQVKVVVHPESIIHSMVEFVDGVVIAQLSVTDMRIPIQYALSYPQRLESGLAGIDFCRLGSLTFDKPDLSRFPCLELAYTAARTAGTAPAVLNGANEVCVEAFLKDRLSFNGIPTVVAKVLKCHRVVHDPDLKTILAADAWAKARAGECIGV